MPLCVQHAPLTPHHRSPPPKSGGALADDATYVQVRMDADRALLVSLSPPAPLADPIRLVRTPHTHSHWRCIVCVTHYVSVLCMACKTQ